MKHELINENMRLLTSLYRQEHPDLKMEFVEIFPAFDKEIIYYALAVHFRRHGRIAKLQVFFPEFSDRSHVSK